MKKNSVNHYNPKKLALVNDIMPRIGKVYTVPSIVHQRVRNGLLAKLSINELESLQVMIQTSV